MLSTTSLPSAMEPAVTSPEPAWLPPGRLTALARDFPAWDIQRVSLHPTWVAVMRRGTMTRVLAAHDLGVLRAKLAKAEIQSGNPATRRTAGTGDDTPIDRDSTRHAYQQVADAIAGRITADRYTVKLPSERDLAEEFGVSYPTVRHATAILRERGLIVTIHGRGTFVTRA